MAPQGGTANTAVTRRTVEERLFDEPYSFEFVQAVRLDAAAITRIEAGVGLFQPPRKEVLRFGVVPSLSFPASEIFSLEQRDNSPPMMRVNFWVWWGRWA